MSPKQKSFENTAQTIIKNLEKRQMEGYYCENAAAAVEKALSFVEADSTVTYGGSETLNESGLKEALRKGSYNLLDRDKAATPEIKKEIEAKTFVADYYFMSTNAITLDGELINVDGSGNRVAALIYGPKNVIIITGMNKIVPNVESGLTRVRNFAAPPNVVRLNKNTPCFTTGKCHDCLSPDCICNQTVITRRSGIKNRIKVILVGEELGY